MLCRAGQFFDDSYLVVSTRDVATVPRDTVIARSRNHEYLRSAAPPLAGLQQRVVMWKCVARCCNCIGR